MSDILLVAVNSSFSHTNIAVRYLKYYADRFLCSTCTTQGGCDSGIPKGECDKAAVPVGNFDSGAVQGDLSGGAASPIQFCEFTINQPLGEIIRGINSQNPKIILFSTYIWNIETVVRIAKNIKALRPEIVVAAGGPEAGFRGSDFLKENPDFDFVMKGEGEETFRQVVEREKASAAPVPQGDLDNALSSSQCAAAPAGDLGFVPGTQQCAAPQGNALTAQQCAGSVPQGNLDGVLTAQHSAAAPQGDFVPGAQHSAAAPQGDFVPGAQHSAAAPQGALDGVLTAQQCAGSVPQGEFVLGAQQCGMTPQGDLDNALSSSQCAAAPAGDLGFVPGTQQCAAPQGNALTAQQCAAPAGDLGFVSGAQQCADPQGDFVPGAQHCAAAPAGDLGFVPGTQHCAIPQGNAPGAQQCAVPVPQGEFVLGAQQCAAAPAGALDGVISTQQSGTPQGNALTAQQCGTSQGDSDLSQGAAPAGDLGNALSAQQCGGSVPQGDFDNAPGAQQCGVALQGGQDCGTEKSGNWREEFLESLKNVKGLYLRNPSHKNDITFTGEQELICDLGTIPFPYPDLEKMDVDHKIFYYESSRGCPFSCAYCMSSLDTKVRFVPLEKVYADLQRFLDAGVKLVKFVDRTYNLKPERYVGIWKYIMEHHNGKTMFHFEIEGEFLSEEAMEFLQTVPEGIMQFEIGVQSSNPVVLKACGRSPETKTLRENILRIPKTIHTHLDLIAGLPFEDLESFGRSFDFVMSMEPDELQLGFLKVLYGAPVNSFCGSEPGWKWMKTPPYEILETPYLSYDEILFLKDLETALDAYWNDHYFDTVIRYLAFAYSGSCHSDLGAASQGNAPSAQQFSTSQGDSDLSHGAAWWKLFVSLTKWLRTQDAFSSAHQKDYWTQMLHEYLEAQEDVAHHGGFVLTAQQCAATAPQGDFDGVMSAQQCGTPSGDFDSSDLDNVLALSQCGTPQGDSDLSHCAATPKGNAPGAQHCAAVPASDFDSGDLDAAPSAQQCATVPSGDLDNAPGAQQCAAAPQGDFDSGDLDNVLALSQCGTPQGNAPGAQQCATAPSGTLDNAASPQQCATPKGIAPGAQHCAAVPASDFDSGDLDNALSSSQCNVARELLRFDYIAGGKKTNPPAWLRRNYDDQGHYDALQNTTGIRHSRLDFVYSDFDTFSVNPLDPATWHAAPAAPSGDLDKAPSEQQCGTPQGDPDNVERSQQGVTYSVLFLYARKESDHPTDFQRVPHQILIH